jgi:hypothetical protein
MSSDTSGDEDEEAKAVEALTEMGFPSGLAINAIMRAGGDVLLAANLLAREAARDEHAGGSAGSSAGGSGGGTQKKGKGKKKGRAKQQKPLGGGEHSGDDCRVSDDDGAQGRPSSGSRKKGGARAAHRNGGATQQDFKARRQAEIAAKKAKRDSRQSCRVCGGPHPRKECPGIHFTYDGC